MIILIKSILFLNLSSISKNITLEFYLYKIVKSKIKLLSNFASNVRGKEIGPIL